MNSDALNLYMAMLLNMNRSLVKLNFYFTANKKTYLIQLNPKDKIWQFLYRFSVNEKELKGIIYFSVSFKGVKVDIDTSINELDFKPEDTFIIESIFPPEQYEKDNVIKSYIKPFPEFSGSDLVGIYEGQLKNGLPEGNGRYFHIMGFSYNGQWKAGKYEGKGIEKTMQGETYEGNFKNNKRHGKGIFTTADGEIYEGYWENGVKHGKGKTTYPNGDIYEGEFKNNLPNGKGVIKWINGNRYEGDMKDDLMDGNGVLTSKSGDIYEGDFVKDQRSGKGKMKFANGDIYEGEFLNGDFNGKGKFYYKSGNYYEGEFKDNKRNGKGIYKYKNGDIYEGDFMNDCIDGIGKMKYADGKIEEGLWENGKFQKNYNEDNYPFSLNCIKTIDNPHKAVHIMLQLKDERLISGSEDGYLTVYNKDNFEVDLSIKVHSEDIYSCIQLNDGRILTCSKDSTMKIIKLKDDNKYEIEASLESHKNTVLNAIEIKENKIISISLDKTMKIWDLTNFQNIETIENICNNILKINENEFITSYSEDKCIKFWNSENLQNTKIIKDINVTDVVRSMCLFNENLLFIGGDGVISLIDIKKYELIMKFEIDGVILSLNKSLDENIFCSIFNLNRNNHIIKYHYDNGNLVKIYEKKKAHNNPIFNCFQLKNGIIVSAEGRKNTDSYQIKFWKILEKNK